MSKNIDIDIRDDKYGIINLGGYMSKNIDIDIRDDKFLFPNGEGYNPSANNWGTVLMLPTMRKHGINTVRDLINCKASDFSSTARNHYMALAQIFKYRYLNQDLYFDVIFDKEYSNDKKGRLEALRDLKTLGFKIENRVGDFRLSSMLAEKKVFTIEYILQNAEEFPLVNIGGDFVNFYLNYIKEKRKKTQQEEISNDVLKGLIIQLQGLLTMRDGIDMQIQAVEKQINSLSKGETSHGRK